MEMKKEISPVVFIAVGVVVLGIVGFLLFKAFTGTTQTVDVKEDPNRPKMINGKPVPAGVPVDYMQRQQGGQPQQAP